MYEFQFNGIDEVYSGDTKGKKIKIPIVSKPGLVSVKETPKTDTINVNYPIAWDKFRELPSALQIPYINYLKNTFAASNVQIAHMMGIDNSYVGKILKKLGIKSEKLFQTPEQKAEWEKYISSTSKTAESILVPEESEIEEKTSAVPIQESVPEGNDFACTTQTIEFEGNMSVEKISALLNQTFPDGTKCSVRIEIKKIF